MFVPNPDFPKEIEGTNEFRDGLKGQAEVAAERARQFAPIRTGSYRDGIKVIEAEDGVYLTGQDFKSNWIEFGTLRNPVSAPLRRGARAAGLRLEESE